MVYHRAQDYPFLCPQFCHIEQLTVLEGDFCIYNPKAAGHLGLSELQKGKIHFQEHYFLFQVTQYLKDKTIEGCGGRSGGRMSIRTSLVIFEGGIFSLLLLWVLWVWFRTQREWVGGISKFPQIGEAKIHDHTTLKRGLMEPPTCWLSIALS